MGSTKRELEARLGQRLRSVSKLRESQQLSIIISYNPRSAPDLRSG